MSNMNLRTTIETAATDPSALLAIFDNVTRTEQDVQVFLEIVCATELDLTNPATAALAIKMTEHETLSAVGLTLQYTLEQYQKQGGNPTVRLADITEMPDAMCVAISAHLVRDFCRYVAGMPRFEAVVYLTEKNGGIVTSTDDETVRKVGARHIMLSYIQDENSKALMWQLLRYARELGESGIAGLENPYERTLLSEVLQSYNRRASSK